VNAVRTSLAHHQRGFTIIEIMVGLVIGLIAVLVTYQVFNVSEQFKRNTTALADTQQNGLLSSFLMSLQLANANNGIAIAGVSLDACPSNGAAPDTQIASTLRPIPVLISPGIDDMHPDHFVTNYSSTSRLIIPAEFNSKVVSGIDPTASYQVQSPTGFQVGDWVVLIGSGATGTGTCGRTQVTAISPTDTATITALTGYVTLTHTGFVGDAANCPPPAPANTYCGDSTLLNLGPTPQRLRYDIDTTTNTLRSTDLWNNLPPQPLAANVVNMKLQYGIDSNNDGLMDKWVNPVNGGDGDFSPTGMMTMSYADLSRIKAIRIAVIVRSEQFDRNLGSWSPSPAIFSDCVTYTCPTPPSISYPALTSPPGNYRYRSYETIVPLRNAIWNIQK
jgi:type IV pilus assembly protein PilW